MGSVPQGGRHVGVPLWRPNEPGDTAFVRRLVAEGAVVPVVDSVVPLDGIVGAFERFDRSAHIGKIVVSVSD